VRWAGRRIPVWDQSPIFTAPTASHDESMPSRPLTNDYQDCKLVKLDSSDPRSPLIVMQEGYVPGDAACRVRTFYLQRNGFWIDEIARSTLPDSEAGDVVFESATEVVQLFSGIFGPPLVRQLPVSDADVQAYLSRVRSGTSEGLLRQFLARYRAAKSQSSN
jgi:hypothetical protein